MPINRPVGLRAAARLQHTPASPVRDECSRPDGRKLNDRRVGWGGKRLRQLLSSEIKPAEQQHDTEEFPQHLVSNYCRLCFFLFPLSSHASAVCGLFALPGCLTLLYFCLCSLGSRRSFLSGSIFIFCEALSLQDDVYPSIVGKTETTPGQSSETLPLTRSEMCRPPRRTQHRVSLNSLVSTE